MTVLIYNNDKNDKSEYKWLLHKNGEELGYFGNDFQDEGFKYSFLYHHRENDITICDYE